MGLYESEGKLVILLSAAEMLARQGIPSARRQRKLKPEHLSLGARLVAYAEMLHHGECIDGLNIAIRIGETLTNLDRQGKLRGLMPNLGVVSDMEIATLNHMMSCRSCFDSFDYLTELYF